jgi:hypothetical protein
MYWIFQSSGYGWEGYGVTRPTTKSVEIEARYVAAACGPR